MTIWILLGKCRGDVVWLSGKAIDPKRRLIVLVEHDPASDDTQFGMRAQKLDLSLESIGGRPIVGIVPEDKFAAAIFQADI